MLYSKTKLLLAVLLTPFLRQMAFFIAIFLGCSSFIKSSGSLPAYVRFATSVRTFGYAEGVKSPVLDVAEDHSGRTWVATQNGILRYEKNRFIPFEMDDVPASPAFPIHIETDFEGNLWVFYGQYNQHTTAIFLIDPVRLTYTLLDKKLGSSLPVSAASIQSGCVSDEQHNLYMITNNPTKLLVWKNNRQFLSYPLLDLPDEMVPLVYHQNQTILCQSLKELITIDLNGKVLFRKPLESMKPVSFASTDKVKLTFKTNNGQKLVVDSDNNNIWTDAGVVIPSGIELMNNLYWVSTCVENRNLQPVLDCLVMSGCTHIQEHVVTFLDKSGGIWVGTPHHLYLFEVTPKAFAQISSTALTLPQSDQYLVPNQGKVTCTFDLNNGATLIGASNGLFQSAEKAGALAIPVRLDLGSINAIIKDRQEQTWLATSQGLFQMLGDNPASVLPVYGNLPKDTYFDVLEDPNGLFWLATASHGLIKWDSNRKKVLGNWSNYQAFPADSIFKICEDQFQRLWLTTNKGVVSFQKTTGLVYLYPGARGVESIPKSILPAAGGADPSKITLLSNEMLGSNVSKRIPFHLSEFRVVGALGEEWINWTNKIAKGKLVELDADNAAIQIGVDMSGYWQNKETHFAYRILGTADSTWNYFSGTKTEVRMPNPGDFRVVICACDENGIWSNHSISVPVKVRLPMWEYLKVGLLLIGFFLSGFAGYKLVKHKKIAVAVLSAPSEESSTEATSPKAPESGDEGDDATDVPAAGGGGQTNRSVADQQWVDAINRILEKEIGNNQFNLDSLAENLGISRATLNRHITRITGVTPNEYLNNFRYEKARQLLESRAYHSVTKVCQAVGLHDVAYFSKQFKKRFGGNPKDYL